MKEQQQADPKIALQYLSEVASTYAQTLNGVERAPFINQVNMCMKVIAEDREQMAEAFNKMREELKFFHEAEQVTSVED